MKIRVRTLLAIIVGLLFGYISYCIPYYELVNVPQTINLTESEVSELTDSDYFGKFITPQLKQEQIASSDNNKTMDIIFKIFNLFPIKKIKANVYANKEVYVGGELFGFSLTSNGTIVDGINNVQTNMGLVSPSLEAGLKVNDVLVQINDIKITNSKMLNEYICNPKNQNKEHSLSYVRDGKLINTKIKPVLDTELKTYRLGAWVRDEITGIGTLTYSKENLECGGLGHGVTNAYGKIIDITGGNMFACNFLGVKKGQKGVPGEIRGLFESGKESQGVLTKNNNTGLFGKLKDNSKLYSKAKTINIGGRFSAKPGKAKILCDVDGSGVKEYTVEIIKATSQSVSAEKSMVLRVIDKELLNITGGIVQGMSGSPIIQNNKLVGALTHVFVNDPTKGYGIYLDWMLEN